jgi:O-acetyl-ADP-ribose deacetylase (regulator of RNase III)
VWHGGDQGEDDLLASCYRECLNIACEKGLASIAFPAISTGIYGFPADRAAVIAVREIRRFLAEHDRPTQVVLVAYDEASLHCLNAALNQR